MTAIQSNVDAIYWRNERLELLDQRVLPGRIEYICYNDAKSTAEAITDMVVRGAPAIGITAAYGVVLSAMQHQSLTADAAQQAIRADIETLASSRPTAVNLFWALDKMSLLLDSQDKPDVVALLALAQRIHQEDIDANHTMGAFGAELVSEPVSVLTHCNAGALATGGYGTALGVIRSLQAAGKLRDVYADETRPWMQGARLTAWELLQDNIPVTLQTEGSAGSLMQQGAIQWVIVGSDRITANGDVANKIGTYNLAVLARYHGVKFMVVAPSSTIDMQLQSGKDIPIEQRPAQEVTHYGGQAVAAAGVSVRNPSFDVTPAELVDYIVTEKGVVAAPDSAKMQKLMAS